MMPNSEIGDASILRVFVLPVFKYRCYVRQKVGSIVLLWAFTISWHRLWSIQEKATLIDPELPKQGATVQKECTETPAKTKSTVPGIPAWSPTAVLTWR